MVAFLKENGFPCTLFIETQDYEDKSEGFKGYESVITDENGKVIKEFIHKDLRARVHWADGYFTALRSDFNKFKESEKLLQEIDLKKKALQEIKEANKGVWDIYVSELCAGSMLAEEEKLQNEINQDMEKFMDTIPDWLKNYSSVQL